MIVSARYAYGVRAASALFNNATSLSLSLFVTILVLGVMVVGQALMGTNDELNARRTLLAFRSIMLFLLVVAFQMFLLFDRYKVWLSNCPSSLSIISRALAGHLGCKDFE